MKRIMYLLMMVALAFGQACEGPEGPEGPPGPEGPQGPTGPTGPAGTSTKAQVVEFGLDFELDEEDGSYSYYLPLEALEELDITVAEDDVVLLYKFRGSEQLNNGSTLYFWGPMPHTVMHPKGLIQYNYIHSYLFLFIYISPQFNLATELTQTERDNVTKNQGFRLVIIPGEIMNARMAKPKLDFNNYAEVASHYNFSEKDVQKLKLTK